MIFRSISRDVRSTLSLNRPWEFRKLVELLNLDLSHRLLDIGVGDGYWTARFGKFVGTAVGIEPDERLLRLCEMLHPRGNVRYDKGVAEKLPYDDESFDRVASVSAVEHFQSPEAAIREMARVVRPSGVVAMSVDCLSEANSSTAFRDWHAARHFVTKYFSTEQLARAFTGANLEPDLSTVAGRFTSRLSAAVRSLFIRSPRIWVWLFPVALPLCWFGDRLGVGGRIPPQIIVMRARKRARI